VAGESIKTLTLAYFIGEFDIFQNISNTLITAHSHLPIFFSSRQSTPISTKEAAMKPERKKSAPLICAEPIKALVKENKGRRFVLD
jgi:hypothetical protein